MKMRKFIKDTSLHSFKTMVLREGLQRKAHRGAFWRPEDLKRKARPDEGGARPN